MTVLIADDGRAHIQLLSRCTKKPKFDVDVRGMLVPPPWMRHDDHFTQLSNQPARDAQLELITHSGDVQLRDMIA